MLHMIIYIPTVISSSIWDFMSKISYMRMIYGLLWKIKGNDEKLGEYIFMINQSVWFNVSEDVFDSKSYWTILPKISLWFPKVMDDGSNDR